MDKSVLVKIFGHFATLIHGDPLVLDRWLWLKKRLPRTANREKLIDVGCGTGAFTIGAAKRGYHALGLSWNERNQAAGAQRARLCKTNSARFEVLDVRELDSRAEFMRAFDVAVCAECIEHVLDDKKLVTDIAVCLKPGGRLLITSPYYMYRAISRGDEGPFDEARQDGWHVRRGYTPAMLRELCNQAGLITEHITYCSGFLSQKIAWLQRVLSRIHPIVAWLVILPLRILPPIFDLPISRFLGWPPYSICLEAYKPRFGSPTR